MAGDGNGYRVACDGEIWRVMQAGAKAPIGRYLTKAQALDAARALASRDVPSVVVLEDAEGTIRERWTDRGVMTPTRD